MNNAKDDLAEKSAMQNDDIDEGPKFGRLLLVLGLAVLLIIVITFATDAYYSA